MPAGGFGNLIALPLQHRPRENGNSVFVDDAFRPYEDQWAYRITSQPTVFLSQFWCLTVCWLSRSERTRIGPTN